LVIQSVFEISLLVIHEHLHSPHFFNLRVRIADMRQMPRYLTENFVADVEQHSASMQIARERFSNPIYDGADPYVVRHDDVYYSCNTGPGGCIEVWKSDSLIEKGERSVVWTPPRAGWNRAEVWAPELHYVRGAWYIYYAASNGQNANHRMGVLRSLGEDPQGAYENLGQMYTGDDLAGRTNNRWAIDGTVLELNQQLYFLWSGWEDERDIQHLYIARMSDPATISSNRVRLSKNNCHLWEHVGHDRNERGLHEGPALLCRQGRVFLIYSCSGSWQATYKLGMLSMDENADPMNPSNWTKHAQPVFDSTDKVFGIGHCSFTTSVDGQEDWILFHAKKSRKEGWDRHVFAQPFGWSAEGIPEFGKPIETGKPLAAPAVRPLRKRAA
jgi:GH43 family beta-xylosidase